ncbi:hypothetical protein P3G55_18830 [Leptospira sp. 96542]|nr:hypothetical protein [Leptospira sp. 96542]
MNEVIPIARIEREARQAAHQFDSLELACPYPFNSDAGHAFASYFHGERLRMQHKRVGGQGQSGEVCA